MDAWCIITVCGVSAFTVDTHAILQRGSGFLWDCLGEGRVPKLARLPALMLHYKMTETVGKDKATEQVLPLFLNVFLIKRLSISRLLVQKG